MTIHVPMPTARGSVSTDRMQRFDCREDWTTGFQRPDPFFGNLHDPQSFHKYLYTHADPVNGIDPTGEMNLGTVIAGVTTFSALAAVFLVELQGFLRGPRPVTLDAQLPATLAATSTLYHSVLLVGSHWTKEEVFGRLTSFLYLPDNRITVSGSVPDEVGDIMAFRLADTIKTFGQRDFHARVVRYDLEELIMVVETTDGHPLVGWRAWKVTENEDGSVLVETWSVDHPDGLSGGFKFHALGGGKDQQETWSIMLRNLVADSGGFAIGGDRDGVHFADYKPTSEYFERMGIPYTPAQ